MNQIERLILSKTTNINCFLSKEDRFSIKDLLRTTTFLKNGHKFMVNTILGLI